LSEVAKESGSAWPTPTARDWRSGKVGAATLARDNARPLSEAVESESLLWPTPTASPNANRNTKPCPSHEARAHGRVLAGEVGGSLNPAFVEAMMGFPADWTVIDGPPVAEKPSAKTSRLARKRASRTGKSG